MTNVAEPASERSELLAKQLSSCKGYQDVSPAFRRCMVEENISTMGCLVLKSEAELLRLYGVGRGAVTAVREFLQQHGLDVQPYLDLSEAESKEVETRALLTKYAQVGLCRNLVDYYLLEQLEHEGIEMITQLVTAPALVLDRITEGKERYRIQLDRLVSCANILGHTLKLRIKVPVFLPEDIPVYRPKV